MFLDRTQLKEGVRKFFLSNGKAYFFVKDFSGSGMIKVRKHVKEIKLS